MNLIYTLRSLGMELTAGMGTTTSVKPSHAMHYIIAHNQLSYYMFFG